MVEELEQRKTVFICYSPRDTIWLERLKEQLKPLEQAGMLDVWDDQRIPPGAPRQEEITQALASASVAVLLVTPAFHASDFITEDELPALQEHTTILWIPIKATLYRYTPLAKIQPAHDPEKPLHKLSVANRGAALVAICEKIVTACSASPKKLPSPPPSITLPPHNLPQQLTSFIGRENEIKEVKVLLQNSRLLTLTGPGGCGKTRLALQVAADVLIDYPDGVWLVKLTSLTDPTLVPQSVAHKLGIKKLEGQNIEETLCDSLKSKRLLLLLDNCERLLPTCAQLIDSLLHACLTIKVLATSRQPFHLDVEQQHAVQGLSQYEAVRLFIERAKLVRSNFTISNHNADAVAQICRCLDGIPLAIELAAARVYPLTVEEINSRLNIHFLQSSNRPDGDKDKTMDSVISWSYDMLNAKEKLLLARLSVFAGGWTLVAVEAICADHARRTNHVHFSEVLELLISLVDKSLVIAEPQTGATRFRLLEMVRQYGAEKLHEGGKAEQVKAKHLDWFLALAEVAEQHLTGPKQQEALMRLEEANSNLRSALQYCLSQVGNADKFIRLTGTMWRFWYQQGNYTEGEVWLNQALSRTNDSIMTVERAKAIRGLGIMHQYQGHYDIALQCYDAALRIWRTTDDEESVAVVLVDKANILFVLNQYETLIACYQQALEVFQQRSNKRAVAICQKHIGNVHLKKWHPIAAQEHFMHSIDLQRQLHNEYEVALTYFSLSIAQIYLEDYEAAKKSINESIIISKDLGIKINLAMCFNQLAMISAYLGKFENARNWFEQALALHEATGNKPGEADVHFGLAFVAVEQGDYAQGQRHAQVCHRMNTELGHQEGIAQALLVWGDSDLYRGRLEEAKLAYSEALALNIALNNSHRTAHSYIRIAQIDVIEAKYDSANNLAKNSLLIFEELKDIRGITLVKGIRGEIALYTQQFDVAFELLNEILHTFTALRAMGNVTAVLLHLSRLARLQNRFVDARRFCSRSLGISQQQNRKLLLAKSLEEFGYIIRSETEDAARVVTLFAAANKLLIDIDTMRTNYAQMEFDNMCLQLRVALGEAFAVHWSQGSAMPTEESIAMCS